MVHPVGGGVVVGPEEIVRLARDQGVPAKLLPDLGSVRTVVEASDRMDREPGEIGNTVLVTVKGDPVLVLVPGNRRVNGANIGKAFGAEPLEVSLATKEEALEHTGYDIGLIPPVGHETRFPLLLDNALVHQETILVPAGTGDALIEVNPKAIARLPDAKVGSWSDPIEDDDG